MPTGYVLGIDQGSTSTKGLLCTEDGDVLASYRIAVQSFGDASDRIEQDPEELLRSVIAVIDQATRDLEREGASISAIGLSCQRSGVCAWNKESTLTPLYTWRNRMALAVTEALEEGVRRRVQEKTFLSVLPEYAAAKISLLQQAFPEAFVGTLDSYLMYHLSDERPFISDDSMASRTMLYHVVEGDWDAELCSFFSVDKNRLASIVPSMSQQGFYQGIPLCAMLGDGQAAVLGMTAGTQASVLNMGTVSSLCIPTSSTLSVHSGYPSGVLYATSQQRFFFMEGLVTSSGSQTAYIEDSLSIASDELDVCIETAQDPHWTAYLPLRGTGSPEFLYDRPCLLQSFPIPGKAELARAALEHIAFSVLSLMDACIELQVLPEDSPLLLAGGIARYKHIRTVLQSCSKRVLHYAADEEASARGAALAALRGLQQSDVSWKRVEGHVLKSISCAPIEHRYKTWKELAKRASFPDTSLHYFDPTNDAANIL